jgi:putative transposase
VILDLVAKTLQRGATMTAIAAVLALSVRTLERWRRSPDDDDARSGPSSPPSHALSAEERAKVVALATSEQYRNLSVRQIVPLLADDGVYVASESTFYRVLREEGLSAHRSPARPARRRGGLPRTHTAKGPREVWTWDITYLRAATRGTFYYLYLVLDIWSRKVVGWEVYGEEATHLAAELAERTCAAEGVGPGQLVIHSDNGGPMKGSTMLATLQRLGIAASFSRPRVSDDNAICEALFRTLKYRPGFPRRPFASLGEARAWVADFVAWYNGEHLHSALRYVTPNDRHERRDASILAQREALYGAAKDKTPRRWTGPTRNWTPIGDVTLNPEKNDCAA